MRRALRNRRPAALTNFVSLSPATARRAQAIRYARRRAWTRNDAAVGDYERVCGRCPNACARTFVDRSIVSLARPVCKRLCFVMVRGAKPLFFVEAILQHGQPTMRPWSQCV